MSETQASLEAHPLRVPPGDLRWCCDREGLDFETTAEVEPIHGVIGQDDAMEALRFGLEIHAPGQNIFVRGLTGTGRMTLVRRLLDEIRPACPEAQDRCYVHDFEQPERPRLISLPCGRGREFHDRVDDLADFIEEELAPALSSDALRAQREELEERIKEELEARGGRFDSDLTENGLALVMLQVGDATQPAIFPVIDGESIPPERFEAMLKEGRIDETQAEDLRGKIATFGKRFVALNEELARIRNDHRDALRQLYENEARSLLRVLVSKIEQAFPYEPVTRFLQKLIDDVVRRRLKPIREGAFSARMYRVNLILEHDSEEACPIIVENTPTLQNLLGTIEREFVPGDGFRSDHHMIVAGSLLRAEGGFLILEARDVISEPGAWKVLVRTLRTGSLEIVPHDLTIFGLGSTLKAEPIDVNVKVILIGDPALYYALDGLDPDFPQLFKVLADFETWILRDAQGLAFYAGVLARIARDEGLLPFARDAVTALAEHGARIAARRDRLTARLGRLVDLAREAAFIAKRAERDVVSGEDVRDAVRRSRRRADLPARRYRERIADGSIRIETRGAVVGQVNGLAVLGAGPLTYGFPARITATIGPGTAGAINIEREAQLSGAIHTKGFYILGGLLRHLLRTPHPLAFSASIAFEQSYGGIDGDSASGAEMCCLLSALTEIPLRQGIAMTGAIDQLGHVQPIGAASEKIEGFFDVCVAGELDGEQGVIIPAANLGDLMLREDVVEACVEGRFHVFAVARIEEALEVFTGLSVGERDEDGEYAEGTLLAEAVSRAQEYWHLVSGSELLAEIGEAEEEEAEESEEDAAADSRP